MRIDNYNSKLLNSRIAAYSDKRLLRDRKEQNRIIAKIAPVNSKCYLHGGDENSNGHIIAKLHALVIANCAPVMEPSTALFSPERSSWTFCVPTYYTPLVKPIHGLISAFLPVGRLFGTSHPNTLVWGHGYQSG